MLPVQVSNKVAAKVVFQVIRLLIQLIAVRLLKSFKVAFANLLAIQDFIIIITSVNVNYLIIKKKLVFWVAILAQAIYKGIASLVW